MANPPATFIWPSLARAVAPKTAITATAAIPEWRAAAPAALVKATTARASSPVPRVVSAIAVAARATKTARAAARAPL